tara:strand:- start:3540 stop:5021 length:1482 start_codon:yes stop_codon:yes gene_type:complete
MSFLRIFNGDVGNSNIFNNDSGIAFKKIYVSGFDSSPDANGEYAPNGEMCNCAPLFKNTAYSKNLTFSNSDNFFNLDDFYILNSYSDNNLKSDFSIDPAYPSNIEVNKDSKFNGSSYLSFNLNTNLNNSSLPNFSYLGILFDDPVEAKKPNYINHNIEDSLVNLTFSFCFDSDNEINQLNGFTLGIFIKQQESYYTFDLGRSGNSIEEKALSLSKNLRSSYFNKISGSGSEKPNLSGSSPYELGFFIGDSKSGSRKGYISNVSIAFNGVSFKNYYIYRDDISTVLSDLPCSTAGLSNFIYSSSPIDSGSFLFDGKRGASSLFGEDHGIGTTHIQNSVATVTKKSHSDLDGVYDYLDLYPFNKDFANISIFRYSNISGVYPSLVKLTFNVEGFQYIYDPDENYLTTLNDIYDYISNLVNKETSVTGIYSQADTSINQFLFWRPKGGDYVKFSVDLEYRGQTTNFSWQLPDSNIDYTNPPTNPSAPPPQPLDPFA